MRWLVAAAGLAAASPDANAQATISDGDLVLGFRASGGSGTTTDYVVNLGTAASLRDATTIQQLPLTGVATDLAPIYGAGWHTRTDLHWGVVAKTNNFSAINSDPASTVYASRLETTKGTLATPWKRRGASSQAFVRNLIDGLTNTFNLVGTAATNANTIARTIPSSESNGWQAYQPGGALGGGISFQEWDPSIEGNPTDYLDLVRLTPDSAETPGTLLGRLVLNSNASLTYIPAAQIGVASVQLSAATFSEVENAVSGNLNVTVTRTGDTSGAASVTISTANGTALSGTDYTALSSAAVNFAAGEASKVVSVAIVNRPGTQGDRDFTVTLGGASGGITIGTQASATCTIQDLVLPSEVQFSSATYSVNQGATSITVGFTRTGGTSALSFTLVATADTAVAGTDYTAPSGTVSIAANSTTGSATITLAGRTTTSHLTFDLAITALSGTNTIGTQGTAVVRLLSADVIRPTVTLTQPSAPAVDENASDSVNVAGLAADDKGLIDRVQIRLNGGAPVIATLTPGSTGASYSQPITPVGGLNTISVQAFDVRGNASNVVVRSFTYVVRRSIALTANAAQGSVVVKPGAVYEVGKPLALVAVPRPGFVFDQWVVGHGTLAAGVARLPKLDAIFTDAMARTYTTNNSVAFPLEARFVANPFTAAVIGDFNGLAIEDGTASASNATNGHLYVKVTPTGGFTGTLSIDGTSFKTILGVFDSTGIARFGPRGDASLLLGRPGKASYSLALTMDLATTGNTNQIVGTLKQIVRSAVVTNSIVTLDRAAFTATAPVPSAYLANKGFYTAALPAATFIALPASDYPQGDGFGSFVVTNIGKITFAGKLADGSAFTVATVLDKTLSAPLFTSLYKGGGSMGGKITFDDTRADSDVAGADLFWFRPIDGLAQYYPWGWQDGIPLSLVGAKFAVPTSASVLPGLSTAASNATLSFSDGLLPTPQDNDVFVSTGNVITSAPAGDLSYKATITAAKGTFAGDFTHDDGSRPKFEGVILQKGANAGGFGFFLTAAPKVINGLGEAGSVTLIKK